MAILESPPLMSSNSLVDAAPQKITLDQRRSTNRKVSIDHHIEEPKQCAAALVAASTCIFTEQEDAAGITHKEISASEEDSDSDASFFFGSPSSSFKKKALAGESAEMSQELKELARLVELHQRSKKNSVQTSSWRKFDIEWILARASPALKAYIHLKKGLATFKRSPFNAIVQSQWYCDFRMFREQVRAELEATGSATSSSLTPPFTPIANTKMPMVLQELAHVLEVHDYNFRPGKQGQISWDWVQAVSSSALVKHILRKQNDPNVRKSYKKCPTAALVPSTHYSEFRKLRSRIWNQLVNHPPAKTELTPPVTPRSHKTPLKAKKLSSKTPLPVRKSSKISSATVTPKAVNVPTSRARKSSPRISHSGLTVEQRELARLMEEVRRKDQTKRVVFDKEYIHANASPALSAYIADRAQLPTFQKNIMRALVSVNKKNAWEAFRLQVRDRMDKGESLDDLMERNDLDHAMTLDDEDEEDYDDLESEIELESEVIISPTPSKPVVVDMRHHAMDAYWLAPSQRLEILMSIDAGTMGMGEISKRRFNGNLPNSKRPRRIDMHEQVASSDRQPCSGKLAPLGTEGVDADSIAFIKSVVPAENPLSFGLMDLALKIEQSALHGDVDWDIVMDRVNPPTRKLILEHRWTPGFSANPELFLISISSVVPFCDVRLKLKNALRA